jgi:hypothetical protein
MLLLCKTNFISSVKQILTLSSSYGVTASRRNCADFIRSNILCHLDSSPNEVSISLSLIQLPRMLCVEKQKPFIVIKQRPFIEICVRIKDLPCFPPKTKETGLDKPTIWILRRTECRHDNFEVVLMRSSRRRLLE